MFFRLIKSNCFSINREIIINNSSIVAFKIVLYLYGNFSFYYPEYKWCCMWFFKSSGKPSLESDAEIVARYKATSDKNMVGLLFDRHAHLVYGICYGYLKDQEACKDAVLGAIEDDDDYKIIEEHLMHLNVALNTIHPKQKECVELFYLSKKSYNEIASSTGYSMNEVKSYIQNGKRNLRIYLENVSRNEK